MALLPLTTLVALLHVLLGLRLLPALYERYNPMSYREAQAMEVELGIALRARGYGVWQG